MLVLAGLWLAGSMVVARQLTRCARARGSISRVPPGLLGEIRGRPPADQRRPRPRHVVRRGAGRGALGGPPARQRRAPGAQPVEGRDAGRGGLLGPAGDAPGPRRLLGRLQRHRLLGPARRGGGRRVPGAATARAADRRPGLVAGRGGGHVRLGRPGPAGSAVTSSRLPTSTSGRPSGTGRGDALPVGLEWVAYQGLVLVSPMVGTRPGPDLAPGGDRRRPPRGPGHAHRRPARPQGDPRAGRAAPRTASARTVGSSSSRAPGTWAISSPTRDSTADACSTSSGRQARDQSRSPGDVHRGRRCPRRRRRRCPSRRPSAWSRGTSPSAA